MVSPVRIRVPPLIKPCKSAQTQKASVLCRGLLHQLVEPPATGSRLIMASPSFGARFSRTIRRAFYLRSTLAGGHKSLNARGICVKRINTEQTHRTTNQKGAGSSPAERTCNPADRVCAKPRPTIHCPSRKIGIGRGLELLPKDGRLRGGASQWRNRLREIEGSAAGCFFEEEGDETFRQETDC